MAITPDTKNWTWVLEKPCPECAFDASTFEATDVADMIRKVGVDNVLFETDFPHPTSLYPIEHLEDRLGDLTHAEKAKVLSLNSAKLYNIAV